MQLWWTNLLIKQDNPCNVYSNHFFVVYQKYQDKYLLNSVTITTIINTPCFKIVLKPTGIIVFLTLYT